MLGLHFFNIKSKGAQAIIITFDLVDKESLDEAENWLNDALRVAVPSDEKKNPLLFLVGTKKDLIDMTTESNRSNTNRLADAVAQRINAEYWQVSSLTGENVKSFFYRLASILFNESIQKELADYSNRDACKRSIGTNNMVKHTPIKHCQSQTSINIQSKKNIYKFIIFR